MHEGDRHEDDENVDEGVGVVPIPLLVMLITDTNRK